MSFHHLFIDRTNIFGTLTSAGSGTASFFLTNDGQRNTLFVISATVGVLTAIHLAFQIYKIVKSILKEKRK